ncbi:MAG: L-2-amino-thiazoline-4-carboxylic acid hydrolase [Clostridiales bacterium]|nr:L-2-amino-thiazoline-4-carboxylic acid hydrolase [Clostridiales bacterium]
MATITMPRGAKRAIKKRLNLMYDKDQAFIMWNKVVQIYNKFEQEQPDIGGKDNFLWDKVYGSLALFAYYEASERSITENEMKSLSVEAMMGNNRILGKILNFNWKWLQKIYGAMYISIKKQTDRHIADGSWHNTWKIEINPEGRKEGVNVHLIGCPVYDFAKAHGYESLMPALCSSDHDVFEPLHCRLIRYHTVANGDDFCDFWQVGDKSDAWKAADKDKLL